MVSANRTIFSKVTRLNIKDDIRQLKILIETLEEEYLAHEDCLSTLSEINHFTSFDSTLADRIRQVQENRMFLGVN